jgi:hypothetical protein
MVQAAECAAWCEKRAVNRPLLADELSEQIV